MSGNEARGTVAIGSHQRVVGLRSFYPTGREIVVSRLPGATRTVLARHARGDVVKAELDMATGTARFHPGLFSGTYAVEALGPGGDLLAEELTTVATHAGERPVHGFATSFQLESVPATLAWLRALRCTVVQVYDWMEQYSAPLGPRSGWSDPSNRPVSFQALRSLAKGIREQGAVAHAYAPIYAVDMRFASAHPELLMYRNDGAPERLFSSIQLANPANRQWQRHFVATYGSAADVIGFNGFHLDTYGFPRASLDSNGHFIDMRAGYASFLDAVRAERPSDLVSFNQVNGVPPAIGLAGPPSFRYCEVWPPNDAWRHLEGLMDRSSGTAGRPGPQAPGGEAVRGTVACYPPVWGHSEGDSPVQGEARAASLQTVVLTEAVATSLGASALLYGDMTGVLRDPYYPKYERLSPAEATKVLAWHRFSLRCRDLFSDGEDTSWYDIGDENGAVALEWDGPVRPEPVGGAIFARVVRTDYVVAVSVLDLSGSPRGLWTEPTEPGRCRSVRARLLLDDPGRWEAAAAVLGKSEGRFTPLPFVVVPHREGLAAQLELPIEAGWSVLRMTRLG
ncbi:MAG: glycoside hydrolase family 66 protein [Acidimicrobiales bacterium]